jgi:hypothetical protein
VTTLAELEILRDEDGRPLPGYLVGKACAVADWRHRKEAREFQELCKRLRDARYHKSRKADTARWQSLLVRRQMKRLSAREVAASTPRLCPCCGEEVKRRSRLGRIAKYCTTKCKRLTNVRLWYRRHRDENCALRRARYALKKAET